MNNERNVVILCHGSYFWNPCARQSYLFLSLPSSGGIISDPSLRLAKPHNLCRITVTARRREGKENIAGGYLSVLEFHFEMKFKCLIIAR